MQAEAEQLQAEHAALRDSNNDSDQEEDTEARMQAIEKRLDEIDATT